MSLIQFIAIEMSIKKLLVSKNCIIEIERHTLYTYHHDLNKNLTCIRVIKH
jgi:hypothetical protein